MKSKKLCLSENEKNDSDRTRNYQDLKRWFFEVSVGQGVIGFSVLFLVTVVFTTVVFGIVVTTVVSIISAESCAGHIRSFTSRHRNTI